MSITISDVNLVGEFGGVIGPVEVRGPDGRYLGEFTPACLKSLPLDISEEELRRREDPSTGRWFTAEQVEARLKELRCSP